MKFDIRICQAIKIHGFQTLNKKQAVLMDRNATYKIYIETNVRSPVEVEQTPKG